MATIKRIPNPLSVTNPELVEEWDYEKNEPLTPDEVTSGTHQKIWWKCKNNHSWESVVYNRCKGVGCPVCAGNTTMAGINDLATKFPDLLKEWDYNKNELLGISPNNISYSSKKVVWWK